MPTCSRCHQAVDIKAVTCPYCRTELKAHGHPGIPLHRAKGKEYLCDTCVYHEDDSCTYPQRPYAKDCTLYRDRSVDYSQAAPQRTNSDSFRLWWQRNSTLVTVLGLIGVSLLLAILRSR
jgi:hypothetical protein